MDSDVEGVQPVACEVTTGEPRSGPEKDVVDEKQGAYEAKLAAYQEKLDSSERINGKTWKEAIADDIGWRNKAAGLRISGDGITPTFMENMSRSMEGTTGRRRDRIRSTPSPDKVKALSTKEEVKPVPMPKSLPEPGEYVKKPAEKASDWGAEYLEIPADFGTKPPGTFGPSIDELNTLTIESAIRGGSDPELVKRIAIDHGIADESVVFVPGKPVGFFRQLLNFFKLGA